MHHMLPFILVFSACLPFMRGIEVVKRYPLLMPKVHPDVDELYLCTPLRIMPGKTFYIIGFQPNASMETAHHMLLYGCGLPGTNEVYWDCGEMSQSKSGNNLMKANPCAVNSNVIYAWARDANALTLPKDVGFKVGINSHIKYLVLQVHYADTTKFKDGRPDNSGISVVYTEKPRPNLAGVILLGTGGVIPPYSTTHMETECTISENKTIYPFAYRTHTHSLGKVVAGYSIQSDGGNNIDRWILLGKRNPLTPQMFYPVFNKTPITRGDRLAARCTMRNNRKTYTLIGATNRDEMCNFYLMYYVKMGTPLDMKYCFSPGPPYYFWDNPENNLNHIPEIGASIL